MADDILSAGTGWRLIRRRPTGDAGVEPAFANLASVDLGLVATDLDGREVLAGPSTDRQRHPIMSQRFGRNPHTG